MFIHVVEKGMCLLGRDALHSLPISVDQIFNTYTELPNLETDSKEISLPSDIKDKYGHLFTAGVG